MYVIYISIYVIYVTYVYVYRCIFIYTYISTKFVLPLVYPPGGVFEKVVIVIVKVSSIVKRNEINKSDNM